MGIVLVFSQGERLGIQPAHATPGYVSRLFDDRRCPPDRPAGRGLGRASWSTPRRRNTSPAPWSSTGRNSVRWGCGPRGTTPSRLTEEYGLSRYSLKLEFDHFLDGGTYHGLDKFSLDASFQDNSYLKTYLAYDMMDAHGSACLPCAAYAWVTVNGTPWGLFLAVEEPEEAFAQRSLWAGAWPALSSRITAH